MDSKVVVVTGGNGGIGFQTALELVKRGATVVIGARSQQRIDEAVQSIKALVQDAQIAGFQLDLSSLQSVYGFAQRVRNSYPQIHGLVCNAGVINPHLQYSAEGVEATFATNHLGHFYLTKLLLPVFALNARVVVTSSGTHDPADKAPWRKPGWRHPSELAMDMSAEGTPAGAAAKQYSSLGACSNSKLCNVLFTYALARKLQQEGSKVTAVAYNPGFIPSTSIFRNMPGWVNWIVGKAIPLMMLLVGNQITNTADKAGQFQAQLAVDSEFEGVTMAYYQLEAQATSSVASHDEAMQQQLWEYSEQLLKGARVQEI